jgi:hypothetical protein
MGNIPGNQISEAANVELWKSLYLMACWLQMMMFVSCKSIGIVPQFCQVCPQGVAQNVVRGGSWAPS